ncbi:MAG: tetratricopeptide repeat protein [Crocinitomicaceae bacterium]|nr:tetratricopeptide repeat protein [Crocinitomicaceae bacterium]
MKERLLLFIALLLMGGVSAQKINKEGCGRYSYEQPPSDMTLQELQSYYVESIVPNNNAYIMDQVRGASTLEGLEKMPNRDAAGVIVKYTVYPTEFTIPEYKKDSYTSEKDGVKRTTYTYRYDGKYTYKVNVTVSNREGVVIHSGVKNGTSNVSGTSTVNATDAKKNYNSEVAKIKKSIVGSSVKYLNSQIENKYCYLNRTMAIKAIKIKPKKYDYDEFNQAVDVLKASVLETDKSTRNTNLTEAIKAWETDLKESDPEIKKARVNGKVTAGAYYNIALAYFMMEDYTKAEFNFKKATEFDKNVTAAHFSQTKRAADLITRMANMR